MTTRNVVIGWVIAGVVIGLILMIARSDYPRWNGASLNPLKTGFHAGEYLADAVVTFAAGAVIASPIGVPLWVVSRKRHHPVHA